ncbi:MAG: DUF3857 domain-containing protein, partial [Planctomycetota bacterium]
QTIQEAPENSRARYYLGWLLMARHSLGDADQRDRDLFMDATKLDPKEGIYFLALARCAAEDAGEGPDRDENLRRLALEQARKLGPDEVAARVELANYYLRSLENLFRAEALAKEAAEGNPVSVAAQTALYDMEKARGWDALAAERLARLLRRNARAPEALLRAGTAALREHAPRRALAAYERLLSLDWTSAPAARGAIESLILLGEKDRLTKLLERLLAVRPCDPALRKERIEADLRADALRPALAAAKEALAIAPEDPELLKIRGRVLHRLGNTRAALESWEEALRIQPNDVDLREYLEFRRGAEDGLGTAIEDLRSFVLQEEKEAVPTEEGRFYFLWEIADRLNLDGTKAELVHFVVKILTSDAAQDFGAITLPYESDRETFRMVSARILREDGKIESGRVTDYVLPEEGPIKVLRFSPVRVGDVIEIAYRTDEFKQGFFGDYFGNVFYFKRQHPTARARYLLESPLDRRVFTHASAGVPAPVLTVDKARRIERRVWEMSRLEKIKIEPFMPPPAELSPYIHVSTFSNWNDLAAWYRHLIKDQYAVTPEIEAEVRRITLGKTTPAEKLAAIYEWVTTRVQNVAWEFGVHGYKPYRAETIFTRRFGDCKDKATLFNVMARAAGIEAWPVLLSAPEESGPVVGRGREDLTLPLFNHFNHSISAVELDGRTLWFDSTAHFTALGEIPSTIAGARALLLKPQGAELCPIAPQAADANAWIEEANLVLASQGGATLAETVTGRGTVASHLRAYFSGQYPIKQVLGAVISRQYGPGEVEEASVEASSPGTIPPVFVLDARILLSALGETEDGLLRFRLPTVWLRGRGESTVPIPPALRAYAEESVRTHDLLLPHTLLIESRFHVRFPQGYRLRALPASIRLEQPFGSLEAEYRGNGETLEIRRILRLKETRIPRESYRTFRRFCHRADEADTLEFVLEKVP